MVCRESGFQNRWISKKIQQKDFDSKVFNAHLDNIWAFSACLSVMSLRELYQNHIKGMGSNLQDTMLVCLYCFFFIEMTNQDSRFQQAAKDLHMFLVSQASPFFPLSRTTATWFKDSQWKRLLWLINVWQLSHVSLSACVHLSHVDGGSTPPACPLSMFSIRHRRCAAP